MYISNVIGKTKTGARRTSVAVASLIGKRANQTIQKGLIHYRFPYNSDFGRRECCGGQTFLNDQKCCVRNQVQDCKAKPGPYGAR